MPVESLPYVVWSDKKVDAEAYSVDMQENSSKISSFTDLKAWQAGHQLVIDVYAITKRLPQNQTFSLADQLQRAVVSVTSNIAEGFARNSSKDQLHFFYMALGSLREAQNQILICRDVGFISPETFKQLAAQSIAVSKLLNGLIKSSKSKSTPSP